MRRALPVDAAGDPWSGSYVYNSGNLVLDLLYNLMLESTGRLQKCRVYEMTAVKTARDQDHENAYAMAPETLGINWGAALPIPRPTPRSSPNSPPPQGDGPTHPELRSGELR